MPYNTGTLFLRIHPCYKSLFLARPLTLYDPGPLLPISTPTLTLFVHHSATPASNQTLPCILCSTTPTSRLGVRFRRGSERFYDKTSLKQILIQNQQIKQGLMTKITAVIKKWKERKVPLKVPSVLQHKSKLGLPNWRRHFYSAGKFHDLRWRLYHVSNYPV